MNHTRLGRILLLTILFAVALGCKSREESTGTKTEPPKQNAEGTKVISGQNAAGETIASPRDRADAEAAAARVLSQMEAGEFSAIYNEAAPGFKQIGSEALFVAKFQQVRQKTGPLRNPKQISFVARPDKTLVLIYRLENERYFSDRRLTFDRDKNGKIELFGLNQHDEPKGK